MNYKRIFTLALALAVFVSPVLAAEIAAPNPQVESETAKALLDLGVKLHKTEKPKNADFTKIATSLARLGRLETALKVASWASPNEEFIDTLRYLSARRSAMSKGGTRAEALASDIKNPLQKAKVLLLIANGYVDQGNYDAAQKVLFQTAPLATGDFDALVQTAYLFSMANNQVKSKRLFGEAKKLLGTSLQATPNQLEKYLLRAQLVDEWKEFHNSDSAQRDALDPDVVDLLLRANQIELLTQTIQQIPVEEQAQYLIIAAYNVAAWNSVRATSLLNQARDLMPQVAQNWDASSVTFEDKMALPAMLSWGYDRVGNQEESRKWLRGLEQEIPEKERPAGMLAYYVYPLAMAADEKSTFSPDLLNKINVGIQSYLPALQTNPDIVSFLTLSALIKTQLRAERTGHAYGNTETLEKMAIELIKHSEGYQLEDILRVAQIWQELGDIKRRDNFLQSVFTQESQSHPQTSKIAILDDFLNADGSVNAILRFYQALPESKNKPPQSTLPALPKALGKSLPSQFPRQFLISHNPSNEAQYLSQFEQGLTSDLFDACYSLWELRK